MEICLKDKLRALRQQKNITQETLANHLGITSQSVGKWERGEAILQKSTDTEQRENVIQYLCYTYYGIDNEKALQYAKMGGSFHAKREDLCCSILEGEEGVKACQEYLVSLIHTAALTATQMISKKDFSCEAVIDAYQFAIDILNAERAIPHLQMRGALSGGKGDARIRWG